jgi:hypothetical protein
MILFGLLSGYIMNKTRKKRSVLPLAHGINNLILTLLALTQMITGWGVIKLFVLGGCPLPPSFCPSPDGTAKNNVPSGFTG